MVLIMCDGLNCFCIKLTNLLHNPVKFLMPLSLIEKLYIGQYEFNNVVTSKAHIIHTMNCETILVMTYVYIIIFSCDSED